MKALTAILTLVFAPLCAIAMQPVTRHVPQHVANLTHHLRMPVGNRGTSWTHLWNYRDTANYIAADIAVSAPDHDYGIRLQWTVRQCADGRDTIIDTGQQYDASATGADQYSSRLRVSHTGATLQLGYRQAVATINVPFDIRNGNRAGYVSSATPIVDALRVDSMPPERYAGFASVEALREYLAASTDPYESLWTYFDRNTDPQLATPGGEYLLATVKNADNDSYDIIYLGGATRMSARWQPLRIKGSLTPTIFIGHFDMQWLDATGADAGKGCTATIDTGNTLLTLNLPHYKAQMRFAKARPSQQAGYR